MSGIKPTPCLYRIFSNSSRFNYNILAFSENEAVKCFSRLSKINPDHSAVLFSLSLLKVVEVAG